jgi:hypothetical protein
MPAVVEKKEGYTLYEASGLYTVQDVEALIGQFDKIMEKDPNARFLLDYSSIINYEQKALKVAYDRMEAGFRPGVKIAFVYKKSGYLYYIINFAAKAMSRNARVFDSKDEAEKWLLESEN